MHSSESFSSEEDKIRKQDSDRQKLQHLTKSFELCLSNFEEQIRRLEEDRLRSEQDDRLRFDDILQDFKSFVKHLKQTGKLRETKLISILSSFSLYVE